MESVVGGKVGGASNKVRQALCAVEPYLGGSGQYVWAVDYLDIVDKHRLVLTVGASYSGVTFDMSVLTRQILAGMTDPPFKPEEIPSMPVTLRRAERYPLGAGTELFAAPTGVFEQYQQAKFTLDVALGEPQILEGEPVVPALRQLVDQLESLIKALIPLL